MNIEPSPAVDTELVRCTCAPGYALAGWDSCVGGSADETPRLLAVVPRTPGIEEAVVRRAVFDRLRDVASMELAWRGCVLVEKDVKVLTNVVARTVNYDKVQSYGSARTQKVAHLTLGTLGY